MRATPPYRADPGKHQEVVAILRSVLLAREEISFAYVFGSFSEAEWFRDVDVGVYLDPFDRSAGIGLCLKLINELAEETGLPVDVQILNGAPIPLLFHALRGELLFYRDEDLLAALIERSAQRYLDIAPLLRHYTKEAFEQ